MTACPPLDQLRHLLDDALSTAPAPGMQAHLESCTGCQQALEQLAAAGPSWDRAARHLASLDEPAGPELDRVVAQLQASATRIGPPTAEPETPPELGPTYINAFADPSLPLGRLGHYQLLAVIGRGGMGVVFRALDERLQRIVAVKALGPQYAGNTLARLRFQREAKAAAGISHDHVVPIYHVDEANGIPYLVMPLIDGKSLQDRIDETGALDLHSVLRIGIQVAGGLAAAHARGLIHRDIKPANILLESVVRGPSSVAADQTPPVTTDDGRRTTDDRVRITDFGLARAVDDASITQSGVITGTPMFMAPEQARGELLDQRADLFSLGSVLYMMATGRAPFSAIGPHAVIHRIVNDTPRPMQELNADVPPWLDAIVAKLHAKHAADRFPSAQEVADLLSQHLAHLQAPHRVPQPPPVVAPARAACRNPVLLVAGRWTAATLTVACVLLLTTCSLVSMVLGGAITAGFAIAFLALRPDRPAPRSDPPPAILRVPLDKAVPPSTVRGAVPGERALPPAP
jgi:serine/threonine-protein kinase